MATMFERSFTGNEAVVLAAQMKFEVLKQHFWGKFAKFNTPGRKVIARKGNEPMPISSPIVMQHELNRKMGDTMKIPLLRNLQNLPTVGKDQLENHEETQKINHAIVPIDIVRHAVKPQDGIMSTQTTKDYKLIQNAKPQLLRYYAEVEEYLGCSYAFYYGFSYNVLMSSRFQGNTDNITAISHPHIFVAGQGKVPYTSGYPGTTAYENAIAAKINAMNDTHVFDTQFLTALKASPQIRRIDPIIMKDGNAMWFIVAHPWQIATLEADANFKALVSSTHVQSLAKDNPLLAGCKHIYGGFAIFESDTAVWQVNVVSNQPVYGPTTITSMESFRDYTGATKFGAILLGNNAMFKATGRPLEFKKRMADYDEILGIAFRTVEGYSRADYWNDDDGTRGQYLKNDGSALLITHAEQPGF